MPWHTDIPDEDDQEPSYRIPTYLMKVIKNLAIEY